MEPEKQLIARVHADKRVFREIVEKLKQQVYYLALDLAGTHADAQGLSQEEFLKQLVTSPIEEEHIQHIGNGTQELAQQERRLEGNMLQQNIEKAISILSPRERSVFILRHYQEFTLKEIAGILSIAEGTVKSLLFRALQRMQKELEFYQT